MRLMGIWKFPGLMPLVTVSGIGKGNEPTVQALPVAEGPSTREVIDPPGLIRISKMAGPACGIQGEGELSLALKAFTFGITCTDFVSVSPVSTIVTSRKYVPGTT